MLMHVQMLLRKKKKNSVKIQLQTILDNRSKKDPQEENVEGF